MFLPLASLWSPPLSAYHVDWDGSSKADRNLPKADKGVTTVNILQTSLQKYSQVALILPKRIERGAGLWAFERPFSYTCKMEGMSTSGRGSSLTHRIPQTKVLAAKKR